MKISAEDQKRIVLTEIVALLPTRRGVAPGPVNAGETVLSAGYVLPVGTVAPNGAIAPKAANQFVTVARPLAGLL